jgi:hypothetical protein
VELQVVLPVGMREVSIDESRKPLVLCRAEVWSADELLEALKRDRAREREREAALLDVDLTAEQVLDFIAALREQRRRAAYDGGEGIDRRAATWEIGRDKRADWEAVACFEHEMSRHGERGYHGANFYLRPQAVTPEPSRDDEASYIDELRAIPEVACIRAKAAPEPSECPAAV